MYPYEFVRRRDEFKMKFVEESRVKNVCDARLESATTEASNYRSQSTRDRLFASISYTLLYLRAYVYI